MLIRANKHRIRSVEVVRSRVRHIEKIERHAGFLRGFGQTGTLR